jgi:hypothetical protein
MQSAGERDYISDVFDFAAFDVAIFGVVIAPREQFDDGGETGSAVRVAHDFLGDKAMFKSPSGPNAHDSGSGVNEDAIHVEEYSSAVDPCHRLNWLFKKRRLRRESSFRLPDSRKRGKVGARGVVE